MTATAKSPLTAGVLGGMGPEATIDFMRQVIALTPAATDQDHVPLLVDHNPRVPDRQAAMRGDRRPVEEALARMARRLEAAGADFLVMPCNTAQAFADRAIGAVSIPFVGIVEATVAVVRDAHPGPGAVGLLATDACLEAGLYQAALERAGFVALRPGNDAQAELMTLIFRIKAGNTGTGVRAGMRALARGLASAGAAAIIAGCTEVPLVLDADGAGVPVISSTGALARVTVRHATGELPLPDRGA